MTREDIWAKTAKICKRMKKNVGFVKKRIIFYKGLK